MQHTARRRLEPRKMLEATPTPLEQDACLVPPATAVVDPREAGIPGLKILRSERKQLQHNKRNRKCGSCTRCGYAHGNAVVPCLWRGGMFTSDLSPQKAGVVIRASHIWENLPAVFVVEHKDGLLALQMSPAVKGWIQMIALGNAVAVMHKGRLVELICGDLVLQDRIRMAMEGIALPEEPKHADERAAQVSE